MERAVGGRHGSFASRPAGHIDPMFVFTKQSGRRGRVRFMWWPLLISLALSVVLTVLLNTLI